MYLRQLFYFAAVIQLVFGLGFLVVPDQVAGSYSGALDPTATAIARYFGGALLPLAWVSFSAARGGGSPLRLALARAYEFIGIFGLIVTWLALQGGVISVAGAIANFVFSAIYTVGFGYYGWAKTGAALT